MDQLARDDWVVIWHDTEKPDLITDHWLVEGRSRDDYKVGDSQTKSANKNLDEVAEAF